MALPGRSKPVKIIDILQNLNLTSRTDRQTHVDHIFFLIHTHAPFLSSLVAQRRSLFVYICFPKRSAERTRSRLCIASCSKIILVNILCVTPFFSTLIVWHWFEIKDKIISKAPPRFICSCNLSMASELYWWFNNETTYLHNTSCHLQEYVNRCRLKLLHQPSKLFVTALAVPLMSYHTIVTMNENNGA